MIKALLNSESILLILFVLLAGGAYLAVQRHSSRQERVERIASHWGRRRDDRGDMAEIALYHGLLGVRNGDVDDRTWNDLDLDAVFRELDRTYSAPGQQTLYARLRQQHHDDLPLLEALVARLTDDSRLRNLLQPSLSRLESPEAYYLPHLFLDDLPPASRWRGVYPFLSLLLVTSAIGVFFHPLFLPLLALSIVANVTIQMRYRALLHFYVRPLRFVHLLVDVARKVLDALPSELSEFTSANRDALAKLRGIDRLTSWLNFDDNNSGDLVAIARQYANMFLLLDVMALAFSLGELGRRQRQLRDVFAGVGFVDVAVATASWRRSQGEYVRPVFDDSRGVEAVALRHPALTEAVPNDALITRSILVTGSNMSGKSTYLRTIGVNVITAQALNTVLAESYRAPRLQVVTSIGVSDSLMEGKSYYLAEVERVGQLLQRRESPARQLFILDELFRGTNTTERIAASFAVLRHLDDRGRHFTVVATHDLELAPMLGEQFQPHHFRELVEEGELRFDYRLQDGVSSTRNAIAILELMKFPPEVVAEARSAAELLAPRS